MENARSTPATAPRLAGGGEGTNMDQDANKRRHARRAVSRPARAVAGARELTGAVTDLSAGGAALHLDSPAENLGEDALIDLYIEDMDPLPGHLARTFEDGIAIEFDLDEAEEDRLLAEVMEMHNAMRAEDR
jgi:hypothetical protein